MFQDRFSCDDGQWTESVRRKSRYGESCGSQYMFKVFWNDCKTGNVLDSWRRGGATVDSSGNPSYHVSSDEDEDDDIDGDKRVVTNNRGAQSNSSSTSGGLVTNVEDLLFDVFRRQDSDSLDGIAIKQFLKALENTGIRYNDPRLKRMVEKLNKLKEEQDYDDLHQLVIGRKEFKRLIIDDIVLISRALRRQLIIPDFEIFTQYISDFYEKAKLNNEGKVADYIAQLGKCDSSKFGISICTIDGQRFSIGDSTHPFTLQSCCKAINYAIALNELGADVVHQYVGQEPSGGRYNDIELDYKKKPHNPMVNSGSILIISLLQKLMHPEMTSAEKFEYINDYIKRFCGDEFLGFNNGIFLAEKEMAADRNHALAYYMKENECFPPQTNIKDVIDLWYQCCAMEVNCDTVAVMAATFANGGQCPITRQQIAKPEVVRDVLSLLHSCGFYDYSGQFAFKVGLPGKSSVAGSMMMVLPNTMGICIYSPKLDAYGNSVRGLDFCTRLVDSFSFHRYDNSHRYSTKINPRRVMYESKGDTIASLMYAAASGDMDNLRRHMSLGHDMGSSDFDGRTPLHLAAAEGHFEAVRFLLQSCSVDPEPRDRWGHTPASEAKQFAPSIKKKVKESEAGVVDGDKPGSDDKRNEDIEKVETSEIDGDSTHAKIAHFIEHWIAHGGMCETLTASAGAALLSQIRENKRQQELRDKRRVAALNDSVDDRDDAW